ncbi:MAG: XrtA system polysaccharide deacetylase [Pseudomonadota bacterium]
MAVLEIESTDLAPSIVARPAPAFAMSVDVEDYFHVWAFSDVIKPAYWDGFALRVEASTRAALRLFDEHQVKATFFILGWVAERAPGLVREIAAAGHEIGSHGCNHEKLGALGRKGFEADARRSKALLEDIAGAPVRGFRAPGFSVDKAKTPWAHEVLARAGYAYSSSTHPIAHDHYGDPHAPRSPYRPIAGADLLEAPVATAQAFGRRISCAGGGWFRAAPYAMSSALLERARAQLDGPPIFYFHPWELDADQPRIAGASAKSKLRHYLNLKSMPSKLGRLLAAKDWGRIDEALGLVANGGGIG